MMIDTEILRKYGVTNAHFNVGTGWLVLSDDYGRTVGITITEHTPCDWLEVILIKYFQKLGKKCFTCHYYNGSHYLPCAVNPSLPEDCGDYLPEKEATDLTSCMH